MVPQIRSWMISTAAGVWLIATLLSAWAGGHSGLTWTYLGALSGTVAGAAFAASGLGLVVQRWQRKEFLRRGRSLAKMTLDLIQIRLGEVTKQSLSTIASAFPALGLFPLDVEAGIRIPCRAAHVELLEAASSDARRVEAALGRARFTLESELERNQDPPLPPEPVRVGLETYEVPDLSAEKTIELAREILDTARVLKGTDSYGVLTDSLTDLVPYIGGDDLVWDITNKASELTNLAVRTGRNVEALTASLKQARGRVEPQSATSPREVKVLAAAEKQAHFVQELLSLVGGLLGDLTKVSEEVARRPRWRAPWESSWVNEELGRLAALENAQQETDMGLVGVELALKAKQQVESERARTRRFDAERAAIRGVTKPGEHSTATDN